MSVSRNMFWFRCDLRLSDQPVLNIALEHIVIFYHSDYRADSFFAPLPAARFRRDFIQESLTEMEISLGEMNFGIHKSILNPIEEIPLLCQANNIQVVLCNRGFSWFERWQEIQLKKRLEVIGVSLEVRDAERFPWMPEYPLIPRSIFTDYRQRLEPMMARTDVASIKTLFSEPIESCTDIDSGAGMNHSFTSIIGGESQAQSRLHSYVRKGGGIETYVETRNGMLGHSYSGILSPYLSAGCCSAAQVYEAVKGFESKNGTSKSSYWLIFELLWRSYFKWIGEIHGYRIYISSGYNGRRSLARGREKHRFMEWVRGETPEPLVNACMRELSHTGYMGNRARQIAASYLIHDLQVEWTWGARYFEHMLIDYDACSNYGNWTYLAGVGSDPRPFRRFNPTLQQEKFDPERLYVNHWMGWTAIAPDEEIIERITN